MCSTRSWTVHRVQGVGSANCPGRTPPTTSAARRERASESIEEAQDVAREVGPSLRELVLARSDDAFDLAARTGFGVCVGVLLLAAVAAALALPSGAPGDD